MSEFMEPQTLSGEHAALVEALEDATTILETEFLGTEGSGHETLLKCKNALDRFRALRAV